MRLLAAVIDPGVTFNGIGNLGNMNTAGCTGGIACALGKLGSTISIVLGVLTISAGLWFVFQIFTGAIQWLSSGGDKQGLENAKKRLTHAIIGLFIVVISYALVSLVGSIFGLDILGLGQVVNFHP